MIPVAFDDVLLGEDLEHLPKAAAQALARLRREVEREGGIPVMRLKRCEAEARDGTARDRARRRDLRDARIATA